MVQQTKTFYKFKVFRLTYSHGLLHVVTKQFIQLCRKAKITLIDLRYQQKAGRHCTLQPEQSRESCRIYIIRNSTYSEQILATLHAKITGL